MDKSMIKSKGVHIFSFCKAESQTAFNLQDALENVRIKRETLIKLSWAWEAKRLMAKIKDDRGNWDFCTAKLQYIQKKLDALVDEFREYKKQLEDRFKIRELTIENITTTVGRTVLARRLSGNNTYTGNISHTALGTNNTAAAVGDTQLGTESYRKALSSGTYANNIAYIETFFTAAEVSGTFQEYGNFIDGTGSANSGQLFNRFLQTVTKSVTETLNVQSTVTFADA